MAIIILYDVNKSGKKQHENNGFGGAKLPI